jgi:hypothetical protein
MSRNRKPAIDVSIDFDFFIREDPIWDWGHREEQGAIGRLFVGPIWKTRYASLDLHFLTDPAEHADFLPSSLPGLLRAKGLRVNARTKVAVAASHLEALAFFRGARRPADMLINIDAHHDLWPLALGAEPNCGNWLTRLASERPLMNIRQVYPAWKDRAIDGPPTAPVKVCGWNDPWEPDGGAPIRRLFLCLSPVWVPPHHDASFILLARHFAALAGSAEVIGEGIPDRAAYAPSRSEAREMQMALLVNMRDLYRSQGNAEGEAELERLIAGAIDVEALIDLVASAE